MLPHLVADVLPQLNGKKHLIAGNHDRCHPKIGASKWLQACIDAGCVSVQIDMQTEIAGEMVLLHHFHIAQKPNQSRSIMVSVLSMAVVG
jgi:calcineurin-like phosphoesterase family protein